MSKWQSKNDLIYKTNEAGDIVAVLRQPIGMAEFVAAACNQFAAVSEQMEQKGSLELTKWLLSQNKMASL